MRIIVLGSAAGGGFPQWNCNCRLCALVRAGDPRTIPRTQASVAVSHDGRRWLLLNASPDLRQQMQRTPALHPPSQQRRGSPVAAVVLTNADVDHVAGLLSLRERQPLCVYATRRVLGVLERNPIFAVLDRQLVERRVLALEDELTLKAGGEENGLAVTAFSVPGKVALWLEGEEPPIASPEHAGAGVGAGGIGIGIGEDTIGLRVAEPATGKAFFYIPGCAGMTAPLARRLAGASLVFFDGTTWSDDELPAAGVGSKTAQRMGHLCMSGANGSIAALADLAIRRKIFIHINNTNPVLLAGSPERRQAEAAGWEIAEDGLELAL